MAVIPLAVSAGAIALVHEIIDEPASRMQSEYTSAYLRCAEYSNELYGNRPDGKVQINDVPDATIEDCQLKTFVSENVQKSDSADNAKLLSPDTTIIFPSKEYIDSQIKKADDYAGALHVMYNVSAVIFGAVGLYMSQDVYRKYKNMSF